MKQLLMGLVVYLLASLPFALVIGRIIYFGRKGKK